VTGASPKAAESSLWKWLRDAVAGPLAHAERLENLVGSGTADTLLCRGGAVVLVELKTCARPARPSTRLAVKVRPDQPRWHASWTRAGGASAWLVQVGSGPHAARYALPGALGDRLAGGLTEPELAALSARVDKDSAFHDLVVASSRGT
jgi:hypothetical protein